ncbi:Pulmonary surfactant-associated protein D [Aphelenchoides avenae]|nr:Pulmonary surfactant-associated protein D [Aphelenchus avenae]
MTGLTKLTGRWEWSDGRPLIYSNWGPYDPHEDGEGDLCATLVATYYTDKGKWSSSTCGLGKYYNCAAICEKDS